MRSDEYFFTYTVYTIVMRTTKMMAVWMYDARNVALRPPAHVYAITLHGMRNDAQ